MAAACGVLLVGWLAWAAIAWWETPRPVEAERAHADLAAGNVAAFDRIHVWNGRDNGLWLRQRHERYDPDGALLVWHTTSGQVRYAMPGQDIETHHLPGSGGAGTTPEMAALVAAFEDAGVPSVRQARAGSGFHLPAITALLVFCTFLATLILGPDPRRGNRWFWFWMALAPLGLGVLAWMATERPWSSRAGPVGTRAGGGTGFVFVLGAGLLVAVAVFWLRGVLGGMVIPG
jgi:hypothetical protein